MFPYNPTNDITNRRAANPVLFCESSAATPVDWVAMSNLYYLFAGKYSTSIAFALLAIPVLIRAVVYKEIVKLSAFLNHVYGVIALRAQKKMQRITARRVIAGMANHQVARIASKVKQVQNASCDIALPIYKKSPIMISSAVSPPKPAIARIGNLDALPESFSLLLGEFGNGTILFSHLMSLLNRFVIWLESVACFNTLLTRSILPQNPHYYSVFLAKITHSAGFDQGGR